METTVTQYWASMIDYNQRQKICEYLKNKGIDYKNCYLVEVYEEEKKIICHYFAVNEEGRKYIDQETGETAITEPKEFIVDELPEI